MTETGSSRGASALDTVKLAAAVAILVGGIAAFYLLDELPARGALGDRARLAGLRASPSRCSRCRAREFWDFVQGRASSCARSSGRRARRRCETTLVVFVADRSAMAHLLLDRSTWILGGITAALDRSGELTVALRWYVVHAYSDFEHKVSESLQERIKLNGPRGQVRRDPRADRGSRRDAGRASAARSERKFFPGYVLVQMEMNEDTWHLVRETAEGARLHRRHAGEARADHRARGERDPAPASRKAPRSRGRRCCSSRARWCASSDGPFNDFSGVVESVELREEPPAGGGVRSSGARRPWSSISARSRRPEPQTGSACARALGPSQR
ncbi:MAG: hypothetical protein MZV65_31510 [Chromatiales bacterium]|nr:hypothetical protein [Chromatiales bacterium]